jgi:hypothetical protein
MDRSKLQGRGRTEVLDVREIPAPRARVNYKILDEIPGKPPVPQKMGLGSAPVLKNKKIWADYAAKLRSLGHP